MVSGMASVVALLLLVGLIGVGLYWIARSETEHLQDSASEGSDTLPQPLLSSEG
jgi:hypothetical protein